MLLESTKLLAAIKTQSGQIGKATSLYRRYLKIADKHLPPGHELVMAIYNFGAYMTENGFLEEGLASLQRATAIAVASFGAESSEEAHALYGMATVFSKKGELGKAESHGCRALAIFRKHEANHQQEVISCISLLANVYQLQEKILR